MKNVLDLKFATDVLWLPNYCSGEANMCYEGSCSSHTQESVKVSEGVEVQSGVQVTFDHKVEPKVLTR